eukprot:sb/3474306/
MLRPEGGVGGSKKSLSGFGPARRAGPDEIVGIVLACTVKEKIEVTIIQAFLRFTFILGEKLTSIFSLTVHAKTIPTISSGPALRAGPNPENSKCWKIKVQSDPDLVPSYLVTPRFSDTINFPRYRKLTLFDLDLVPTPI